MTTRALILGGGLGGLAAAIGLRNAGADTTVLERNSPDRLAFQRGIGASYERLVLQPT